MILNNYDIIHQKYIGNIEIDPYTENHVEANGYDLILDSEFLYWGSDWCRLSPDHIRVGDSISDKMIRMYLPKGSNIVLAPNQMVLGCSVETVKIPPHLCGILHTRSSIARLGVAMHLAAGDLDPGFEGQVTFEILNHSPNYVEIPLGIRCAKLVFMQMSGTPTKLYTGRYQGQKGPQASRLWLPNKERD